MGPRADVTDHSLAACAGQDPAEWDDNGTPHAHNLCRDCPMHDDCLADARAGVMVAGGKIVKTNGVMRAGVYFNDLGRESKPKPPRRKRAEHGTNSGYYRHLRAANTPPCELCMEAHAAYQKQPNRRYKRRLRLQK